MVVRALVVDVDALVGIDDPLGTLRTAWPGGSVPTVVWLAAGEGSGRSPAPDPAAGSFALPLVEMGVAPDDPHLYELVAALAGCRVRDVAVVLADGPAAWREAARATAEALGCQVGRAGAGPGPLAAALDTVAEARAPTDADRVGVGPHPAPWPDDDRLDPALLAHGDRRNVVDRYRYWSEAAIVEDLARTRHRFAVAVENWRHDLNIGTVVRNANAFNASGVHIVGRRRWNRRGAMATDRYLPVHHHPDVADLVAWCRAEGLVLVGIDNVAGAVPLERADLPAEAMLVFGQEGPGLSAEVQAACAIVVAITQYGSTRSLNAGVASGIAMHAWVGRHGARGALEAPSAGPARLEPPPAGP